MPVNKLSDAEAAELIAVLNSQRFVDKAPPQIYATLLAEGTYLCSISTMYRTLERNRQVKDRRRQATHPPRKVPELQSPPDPGRFIAGISPNSPARSRASISTAT